MTPRRVLLPIVLTALLLSFGDLSAEVGDIVFTRKTPDSGEVPAAVFPHFSHRMQFKCYVCHDALFQMSAGANAITMDAIQAGKFCGACHTGVRAFQATFDTCPRCHRS
jgi:c(7)-type cytochrome triheme protein